MYRDSEVFRTESYVYDENHHNCPETQDWRTGEVDWKLEVNCKVTSRSRILLKFHCTYLRQKSFDIEEFQ